MATTSKDIGRFLEARLQEKGADAVMTYKDLITVFSDLPDLGPFWSAHPLCAMFGCDTMLSLLLSCALVERRDLRYCPQSPTGTCVVSNHGVRSSRDNVASFCHGRRLELQDSRRDSQHQGGWEPGGCGIGQLT